MPEEQFSALARRVVKLEGCGDGSLGGGVSCHGMKKWQSGGLALNGNLIDAAGESEPQWGSVNFVSRELDGSSEVKRHAIPYWRCGGKLKLRCIMAKPGALIGDTIIV